MARSKQGNESAQAPSTIVPTVPRQPLPAIATIATSSYDQCATLLEGQRAPTLDITCPRLISACEEFCSALNIPPPRYQDISYGRRGFTSQVGFGYVDNQFGKHSSSPKLLHQSRGEAARRALQWLKRSGLLPRSRLEYGLAGASGYFSTYQPPVRLRDSSRIPVPSSTNPQSWTGEYQCLLPVYVWHNSIDQCPHIAARRIS